MRGSCCCRSRWPGWRCTAVADDDADLAFVLALDARDVLFAEITEQVGRLAMRRGVQADVIERVDEAQVPELGVFAGDRGVGRLDVQVGHVARQDRHLVGVQLFLVLVLELGGLTAKVLEQLANEGARPGGRVEDLDVLVDQVAAEVLLAQPVGALDHEADDLVRRVDNAESVRSLGVVNLVEVLVDDLEEGLLLVVAADLRRRRADGGVVGLQALQRALLQADSRCVPPTFLTRSSSPRYWLMRSWLMREGLMPALPRADGRSL